MDDLLRRLQQLELAVQASTAAAAAAEARATAAERQLAAMQSAAATTGRDRPEIVDTKILQKPQVFTGNDSDWANWSFKMTAYAAALDGELAKLMEACKTVKAAGIMNIQVGPQTAARSRQLYYIMVLKAQGKGKRKDGKTKKESNNDWSHVVCWYCEKPGHIMRDCLHKKKKDEKQSNIGSLSAGSASSPPVSNADPPGLGGVEATAEASESPSNKGSHRSIQWVL